MRGGGGTRRRMRKRRMRSKRMKRRIRTRIKILRMRRSRRRGPVYLVNLGPSVSAWVFLLHVIELDGGATVLHRGVPLNRDELTGTVLHLGGTRLTRLV